MVSSTQPPQIENRMYIHTLRQPTRRGFLTALGLSTAGLMVPGAFAEELTRTASVEEGPYYPYQLPLDTDNDLLIVNDSLTPAVGEVTHLSGRLLDASGSPIRNALIEIWQVDSTGTYLRNDKDFLYRDIREPKARDSVTVDFLPVKGSRVGELAARFDIVMGFTPAA